MFNSVQKQRRNSKKYNYLLYIGANYAMGILKVVRHVLNLISPGTPFTNMNLL